MTEKITKRVGRIISGSINAIVNTVENTAPELVMEQAIREIEIAIDEVRSELGKIIASKHMANKRLIEKNTRYEELSGKIEVAVANNRDDLAEAAISNQLDIEAQMPVLENTIVDCGEQEKELEGYIVALQGKKQEMKEELKIYRSTINVNSIENKLESSANSQNKINKSVRQATSTFDRILEKKTGVSSMNMNNTQDAAKMAELEQLARQNRIQERLIALKSNKQNVE